MEKINYTKGLHRIGNDVYAYTLPDGSWGWSNAGLVVDGDKSLLIDTLFDLDLTGEMLETMRKTTIAAETIDILVNTHANGDHFYGNELVKDAEIISSKSAAIEMAEAPPQVLGDVLKMSSELGEMGEYFTHCFEKFKFDNITLTLPTKTFEKKLDINLGNKEIKLIEVGPTHTEGDILVYIPHNKTIFTGDIIFHGGTPIMWKGPVSNWLNACDIILDMDVDIVVPGHGPVSDKTCVVSVKEYFEFIIKETKKRFDSGMSAVDAAFDISLGKYSTLLDKERIIINVDTLYREFGGDNNPPNAIDLFGIMAAYNKK